MMEDKERLVKLETQLAIMVSLLQEIRSAQKDSVSRSELEKIEKSIEELRSEIKEIKSKYDSLNGKVIKILTILGIASAVIGLVAKKFLG